MNPEYRRLASEAVIALSLCAGAHFFLVAPAQHQLDETVSQVAKIEAEQRAGDPLSITLTSDQSVRMSEEARQIATAVARFSLPAADDAALFQAVTALAEGHKVRIDQLQPSPRMANAPSAAPTDPGLPPLSRRHVREVRDSRGGRVLQRGGVSGGPDPHPGLHLDQQRSNRARPHRRTGPSHGSGADTPSLVRHHRHPSSVQALRSRRTQQVTHGRIPRIGIRQGSHGMGCGRDGPADLRAVRASA